MDNPVLEVIIIVFNSSASQEVKELVAREYRQFSGVLKRHPNFADINRQIEEIFTAHAIPPEEKDTEPDFIERDHLLGKEIWQGFKPPE